MEESIASLYPAIREGALLCWKEPGLTQFLASLSSYRFAAVTR
jgi:hypothetical protein